MDGGGLGCTLAHGLHLLRGGCQGGLDGGDLAEPALILTNPPAGGTVSFRARAADGQATAQTVIDAYRTK